MSSKIPNHPGTSTVATASSRFVSCKRSPDRLIEDLDRFDSQIQRFLEAQRRFADWSIERVAIAPELGKGHRVAIARAGYLPQDLQDLTAGLAPGAQI